MEEGVDTEHILGEFTDLEFENHKNVKKYKLGQIYVRKHTKTQILRGWIQNTHVQNTSHS